MIATNPPRSIWSTTPGLSFLLFVVVILASAVPFVRELQSRVNDTYLQLGPKPSSFSPVVLVLIDDESLRQYGRWPWSRTLLAQLVRSVGKSGATIIGLDILLTEPQSAEADSALRDALDRGPHVVLADKIASYADGPRWLEPISALRSPNVSIGQVVAPLDRDGVCRRFIPLELAADGNRWALAVEMARRLQPERVTSFLATYGIDEPKHTGAVTIVPPVLVPIAFRRDRFQTISAARILRGIDLNELASHPVLIGFGPSEISDRLMTPISGELPTAGVEINAQILDGILTRRPLREGPPWLSLVLALIACPLLVVLFRQMHSWPSVTVVFLLGLVIYGLAFLAFVLGSYLTPIGPVLTAVVLAPLMTSSADFLVVERSLTLQLRQLQRWLFSLNRRTVTQTSGLSWKLRTLEDLQGELGALYELHQALLESTQDAVAIFNGENQLILKNQHFLGLVPIPGNRAVLLSEVLSRLGTEAGISDQRLVDQEGMLDQEIVINGCLYAGRTAPLPPTTLSPKGGTILTLTSLQTRQERDRARAEALGFLTHELRTPLASIQQFADLMMQYPNSPACAGAPETIFRESKRLLALIGSYLDVLRLDAGARPLHSEEVDMEAVVAEVFDILRPLAVAARMKLKLVSNAEAVAIGDRPLLTGAVLNLVSNAIKYGTSETEIHVSCVAVEQTIVLSVRNEAHLISEQDVPHFFEAHYRSSSTEASIPGWGLGLAFVKRIAEKHGGSVCASTLGSQIKFEIHLPARAVIPAAGELA